jgi:putative protease
MNSPHKIELLAPAGTLEAGLAAFEHGADAIYCGLSKFNARERGENFSFEDLAKLIGYARRQGKRVHIALNTLLKPSELPEALEMAGQLSLLGPDAVIVQDLGLLKLLHDHFPELELHGSTQMGVHNSAGIATLAKLGAKRAILERQVTLAELAEIRKTSPLPVEVFVHGALCCCRSGSCLFSSWMGGWSGNRGKCKQPCRRRFFSKEGNGFFFSPGDLCLIDRVPDLVRLGVASLKIEGRLRGPDYVAAVVTAYRMVLDACAEPAALPPPPPGTPPQPRPLRLPEALAKAKKLLSGSLGRRWSEGFVTKESQAEVIQHTTLGGSGRPCGQIVRGSAAGFTARITREINLGERLRIQPKSGDEGPSLTVTKMIVDRKSVSKAFPNEEVFFAWNQAIPHDGILYQIALAPPVLKANPAQLPVAQALVPLEITVSRAGLAVSTPLQPDWRWEFPIALEPARGRGIDPVAGAAEWRKGNAPRWLAGNIRFIESEPLFLAGSELRGIRQEFWKHAAQNWPVAELEAVAKRRVAIATAAAKKSLPPLAGPAQTTVRLAPGAPARGGRDELTAIAIEAWQPRFAEAILPPFCAETNLEPLRKQIAATIKAGCRRFRITSLYHLDLLRGQGGLELTASFPLPVCNPVALAALLPFGIHRATAWVELDKTAIDDLLAAAPGRIELFTHGRLPLLETRAALAVSGDLRDARGGEFRVEAEEGLTRLYSGEVLSLPRRSGVPVYIDLSHARPDEPKTSTFNYENDFV